MTPGWSPITQKMAILSKWNGAELSFHLGGKQLAYFGVKDLGKLEVARSSGSGSPSRLPHDGQRTDTGDKRRGFVIEACKTRLKFDIQTGKLLER